MQEDKFINLLQKEFLIPSGIGDDAAIFSKNYVISKDLLVEDVHFRVKYSNNEDLAYKALQVNLSDIAAMGAEPLYVLLGIAIPKSYEGQTESFLTNFSKECKNNNLILIGGDTTSSPNKLFISITIIGMSNRPKRRNTAKIGDIVCVAGNLGHAHIGLQALENGIENFNKYKKNLLRPKALLKEGIWLGNQASITSMMDISDGLLVDFKKLCFASNVEGQIDTNKLKITEEFVTACSALSIDPISTKLTGGEDYGLLFTVDQKIYQKIYTDFLTNFSYPLKPIGRIINGKNNEVSLKPKIELKQKIFSHFGELK